MSNFDMRPKGGGGGFLYGTEMHVLAATPAAPPMRARMRGASGGGCLCDGTVRKSDALLPLRVLRWKTVCRCRAAQATGKGGVASVRRLAALTNFPLKRCKNLLRQGPLTSVRNDRSCCQCCPDASALPQSGTVLAQFNCSVRQRDLSVIVPR